MVLEADRRVWVWVRLQQVQTGGDAVSPRAKCHLLVLRNELWIGLSTGGGLKDSDKTRRLNRK